PGTTIETPFPPKDGPPPAEAVPPGPLRVKRFAPEGEVEVAPNVSQGYRAVCRDGERRRQEAARKGWRMAPPVGGLAGDPHSRWAGTASPASEEQEGRL